MPENEEVVEEVVNPEVPNGVFVKRVDQEGGAHLYEASVTGDIRPTEVETILKLALRNFQRTNDLPR